MTEADADGWKKFHQYQEEGDDTDIHDIPEYHEIMDMLQAMPVKHKPIELHIVSKNNKLHVFDFSTFGNLTSNLQDVHVFIDNDAHNNQCHGDT